MKTQAAERIAHSLDSLRIELPSWGFSNTGTRFGKYLQPAAALTIDEKFSDAQQVHGLTGICPMLALHVLWDLPTGGDDVDRIASLAASIGIQPGPINPHLFVEL